MATTRQTTAKDNGISTMQRWMQGLFLLFTFLIGLRHMLPGDSTRGGAFDAFCPFGALETLWITLTTGQYLETTNPMNFTALLAVLGVSLVAGRAFCGWMCPLGTLQDMFAGWARRLSGERNRQAGYRSTARFPVLAPVKLDHWLRKLKYLVLVLILVASMRTVYPPLHNICPARALFGFHWDSALLGLVILVFVASSLLVKRFTCRYLCPLGAALAIFNKFSLIRLTVNAQSCSHCGRCEHECPVDIASIPKNYRSVECVRCLSCLETCDKTSTVELRLG